MLKRNLFLLFVCILLFSVMNERKKNTQHKSNLVRIDVNKFTIIDQNFTLFIPLSLKFGEDLVNENLEGVITLYINSSDFCYKRPKHVLRNEYFLDKTCGLEMDRIALKRGDELGLDFHRSNLQKPQNVALFGELEHK